MDDGVCRSKTPLNALKVQCASSVGPLYERGWDFYFDDLNKGVGGKYIYVGYKRGMDRPVTSINFKAFDKAQSEPEQGWEWSPEDLSKGAGGKYIYMYWKRGEPGRKPIVDLMFQTVRNGTPAKILGWRQVGPDLNRGSGGPYIWAYYTRYVFSEAESSPETSPRSRSGQEQRLLKS